MPPGAKTYKDSTFVPHCVAVLSIDEMTGTTDDLCSSVASWDSRVACDSLGMTRNLDGQKLRLFLPAAHSRMHG